MIKRTVFFLCITLFSLVAKTQINGEHELGAWYMLFGNYRLSDKWSLYSEYHARMYRPFDHWQQMIFSVGATYHLKSNSRLGGGYAYLPTESYNKGDNLVTAQEHRIWQYFFLNNQLGRIKFRHRYQLEERFLSSDITPDVYKTRMRYQILLRIPLTKKELTSNTLYLALADEIFMHIEKNPFDQNRLYGALGYKFKKPVNIELGYMRQSLVPVDYDRLMFALIFNPEFRKKE